MIQIFLYVMAGTILLWFGYTLFFSVPGGLPLDVPRRKSQKPLRKPLKEPVNGVPGAPRTCPVCNVQLENGQRVKSSAFPSVGGERLMHISGCVFCLEGTRRRGCPVCHAALRKDEYLVARLYDKPGRSHVHVLGCSRCKLKKK